MPVRHKILMIAPSAVAGGAEEVLFHLAVQLPTLGVETEVISLQEGVLVDRLYAQEVPVRVLYADRLRNARRLASTQRALTALMARRRYDLVFSGLPKAHLYACWPASRARVPALWCQAGIPAPPAMIDRIASALPAAGVIAVSRDAVQAQQRLNRHRRVSLMHPGIELSRFVVGHDADLRREFGIPLDAILIALVGRLQPWKGQREFIRAAAQLSQDHPTTRFAIVGGAILGWEGDYPAELRRLADELGLGDRVIFTGHTDAVPRWMAASDVVVNASDPEPFGLVVVEAMACGCAVLAVDSGGPKDIIEHGVNGFLSPTRSPEDLHRALGALVADRESRRSLGAAARRRVEQYFSVSAMAQRFSHIAERVIADRRQAPLESRAL